MMCCWCVCLLPLVCGLSEFQRSLSNKYVGESVRFLWPDHVHSFLNAEAEKFGELTGCRVNVVQTGSWFGDVDQDVRWDQLVDGYMTFGSWMSTWANEGYLNDLTDYVYDSEFMSWWDIFPVMRQSTASYSGEVYMVPLDGDVIYMMYRKDLLSESGFSVPRTWEDFLTVAEYFHNSDLNGDGVPDFGACFATAEQDIGSTMFWAVLASYLQTLGSAEGVFFDAETFEPKISLPVFRTGVEMYKRMVRASPWTEARKGKTWMAVQDDFNQKRCALYFNFPGPIKAIVSSQYTNGLDGTLGLDILPGMACGVDQCPYSTQSANHAPFYAGGGMGGIVRSQENELRMAMAFDFLTWLSDPNVSYQFVAEPSSFMDPLRYSHINNLHDARSQEAQAFLAQNWSQSELLDLQALVENVFLHENGAKDLSIVGSNDYIETGTMPFLSGYWNDTYDVDETISQMLRAWEDVTNFYGLASQRDIYRKSLGLGSYVDEGDAARQVTEAPAFLIVGITLGVFVGVCVVALVCWKITRRLVALKEAERAQHRFAEEAVKRFYAGLQHVAHTMVLVSFDNFKEAGRFVQYEEARDRGILMYLDTYQDAVDFCRFNHVFFLSHQWLDATEPDPDNHHYEASVAAITDTMRRASRQNKPVDMKNIYIWVDYMSIPQKNMTLQSLAIDTIAVYAYLPEYFIIIAPCVQHTGGHWCSPSSYLDRGWCRLEQWARMSGNGTDNMYCYTKDKLVDVNSGGIGEDLNWLDTAICVFEGKFSRVSDQERLTGVVAALYLQTLLNSEDESDILARVKSLKKRAFPKQHFGKMIEVVEEVASKFESDKVSPISMKLVRVPGGCSSPRTFTAADGGHDLCRAVLHGDGSRSAGVQNDQVDVVVQRHEEETDMPDSSKIRL